MDKLIVLPQIKPINLMPLPEWLKPREAQQLLFENLAISYRNGFRKQSLMGATAVGKTIFTAILFHKVLTKKPNARLIFIVPRTTLINQTVEEFEKILQTKVSVIRGDDPRIDLSLPIQICTIQSLGNRIEKYPDLFCKYDLAVIDENHIQFKVREKIDSKWIIGLSGSPFSKGMGNFFDDLVRTTPAYKLCEQGIITPLKVLSAKRQINTSKLKVLSTGEYDNDDEDREVAEIIGDVLAEYEKNPEMEGRPFIGFAKSIKSCVALAEIFQDAGHKVAYIHSKMSNDDCDVIIDSFKNGDLIGIFSVTKLVEGFNFAGVSAILLCTSLAPSKKDKNTPSSITKWIQLHGRGRRSDPDNPNKVCLVHDHSEGWQKYSHPDIYEKEFTELCTGKKKEPEEPKESDVKMKACPECGYFIKGNKCLECGHELKSYSEFIDGEVVHFEDGKMVVIEDQVIDPRKNNKEYSNEQKSLFFGGLKGYGRGHGYAPGWASNQYRNKFGAWPNAYKNAPACIPSQEVNNYIKMTQIAYRARKKKAEAMENKA